MSHPATQPQPSLTFCKTPLVLDPQIPLHFVGIGGIGMSGLAKLLLESGYQVTGSDLKANSTTQTLTELGGKIHITHQASNLPDQCVVIVSTAISPSNPEIEKALKLSLPIYHRSDVLREILHGVSFRGGRPHTQVIGATGTHGKTTITGMTGLALKKAQLNPTIIAGGLLPGLDTNAILGGSLAVAEMDESDGTLIQYHPTHTIVANLELDHADHYTQGLEEIVATFQKFLGGLNSGSSVFLNWQCPTTQALGHHLIAENLAGRNNLTPIWIATGDVFSGAEKETTYWVKNSRIWHKGCYQGYVYRNKKLLGELNLSVPGLHNLFNALAAVAVGIELGGDFELLAQGIREFTGMGRRFEKLSQVNGAWLVDDYAHHPTEVSATLKAAKASLAQPEGKVIAIFQPHRYTRLQAFWEDFQTCFQDADVVYLTDVYPASEAPIEGVTTEALVKAMKNKAMKTKEMDHQASSSQVAHPRVEYVAKQDWPGIKTQILESLRPQDIALSMGAGDITQFFR